MKRQGKVGTKVNQRTADARIKKRGGGVMREKSSKFQVQKI
jgi:hypothetical protein